MLHFSRIFQRSDHDNEYMMIDATIVRAHQHSAGARKKRLAAHSTAVTKRRAEEEAVRRPVGTGVVDRTR